MNCELTLKLGKKDIEYKSDGYEFEEEITDFGVEL